MKWWIWFRKDVVGARFVMLLMFCFGLIRSVEGKKCSDICLLIMGNGNCDLQCLVPECIYDLGDCCNEAVCNMTLIQNGICNEECNTEECFFDGGDCTEKSDCVESSEGLCRITNVGNDKCNVACMTKECLFDFGDCDDACGLFTSFFCDSATRCSSDACNVDICGFDKGLCEMESEGFPLASIIFASSFFGVAGLIICHRILLLLYEFFSLPNKVNAVKEKIAAWYKKIPEENVAPEDDSPEDDLPKDDSGDKPINSPQIGEELIPVAETVNDKEAMNSEMDEGQLAIARAVSDKDVRPNTNWFGFNF